MQDLQKCIISGQFTNKGTLKEHFIIRNFLSSNNGLILYKHKIIIPKGLRYKIFELAHEGHQGIVRTKQRLRRKVFWPGISQYVQHQIDLCHSCQVVAGAQPPTPILPTKIPERSWLLIGCDLCGPFPTGEYLLVCVDYHSRYSRGGNNA